MMKSKQSFPRLPLQARIKAPEDWRTPKPGGLPCGLSIREASWSEVALYCVPSALGKFSHGIARLVPSLIAFLHARAEDSVATRSDAPACHKRHVLRHSQHVPQGSSFSRS